MDLGTQFRTLLVHQFLVDQHTVGAEIERRDALRSGHLHPDVPVQAAVDVEVAALGCDVELRFVVADDSQAVRRTGTHIIGDLEDEGVISPPVLAHEAVVDQERGHHPRTFEAQEYALALVRRRDLELFGVGAIAAAVAAAAHEISSIPGVRQVDRLAGIGVRAAPAVHPGHTGRRETPVFVQRDDLACPGQVRGQEGGRKGDEQYCFFHIGKQLVDAGLLLLIRDGIMPVRPDGTVGVVTVITEVLPHHVAGIGINGGLRHRQVEVVLVHVVDDSQTS